MNVMPILQRLFQENRVPSALLIQGDLTDAHQLVSSFLQWVCCETHESCGTCGACVWLKEGHHPDVMEIMAHQSGHAIKIDQIRELQQWAYQSATGGHQWGVIHNAGSMNLNSANALLKILEEPSLKTHFILTVDNEQLLPKTILSRCVRFELSGMGRATENQEKLMLVKPEFLTLLQAYLSEETDLQELIQFFEPHALDDSLWFCQQCCAELITQRLLQQVSMDELPWVFALPLASWWAFWDALWHYRQQLRMGTHFHAALLFSRLFLSLKMSSSASCSSSPVLL